jgi:LPXTG-site transpeptidase (sortase) family protein
MKVDLRAVLLTILIVSSFLIFSYFMKSNNDKSSLRLPARLIIPAINLNANIQPVGINTKEEMEVPDNLAEVGWFKSGTPIGENGNAVISGHFDGVNGKDAAFHNLHKLNIGDKLYVEDSGGKTITFAVRKKQIYDPGYADEIFSPSHESHLNLTTCYGEWDEIKKSYNKRLIVFADLME